MKRILLLISLSFIVACSNGGNSEVTENVDENNAEEIVVSDTSVKFAGIDIVYKRDAIHVTGDVQTTEESFYYTLDNEGEVIVEEKEIKVDHPGEEWSPFTFEVDIEGKDLTNQDVPFLIFYGKDGQKEINPNYVPVDLRFYSY